VSGVSGSSPLRPGEPLTPRFEVVAHLRRGNHLDVYDVWSTDRGCRCVAKTLRPDRRSDRPARARLLAEGALLQKLSHPHLVRCYEVIDRSPPVVILETLAGETLGHLLEHRGRLSLGDAAWLGVHVCSAVGYLHGHGWLHLDLKPSNIVREGDRARLLDLSIARRPGPAPPGAGTPDYMAPEQVTGGELTEAADSWGIGAVLYEALSGQPPYGEDVPEDREPQLEGRAPSIQTHRQLPRDVAALIDACLDPDPGLRPTVPHISSILQQAAGIDPRRPDPATEPTTRRRTGRKSR
jgi:eukaryotic-like serine/threonine-protein kinase